jgi:AMMECR1 domain-containing protein
VCEKAGLEKDAWRNLTNKIYKFKAEIFSEDV